MEFQKIDDNLIIDLFFKNDKRRTVHMDAFFKKHPDIKKYLLTRYDDNFKDVHEIIYRIKNKINRRPVCPDCGKPVKFYNCRIGYTHYCSPECSYKHIQFSQKAREAAHTKEVELKRKKTMIETKGYYFGSAKFQEVFKKTLLEKRKEAVSKRTKEEKRKIELKKKRTCLERYGVEYGFMQDWAKDKVRHTYKNKKFKYDNLTFDSSWELALYIYAKDHKEKIEREPLQINYTDAKGKKHSYWPDFKYKNKLVEIKGDWIWFTKNGKVKKSNREKQKIIEEQGIELWFLKDIKPYLSYIDEKYGKNYLFQFRINRRL